MQALARVARSVYPSIRPRPRSSIALAASVEDVWQRSGSLVIHQRKQQALLESRTAVRVSFQVLEPYNNLAVIWAQRGQYEQARAALESAIASNPDYAIAHENLGDIYTRMAGAEYDRALALDTGNKSAQTKLVLVRQLYAVAPS